MGWRVAKSLLVLLSQVDALAPGRDRSSDGTIGDTSHQAGTSDHNPNAAGVVTALDITNDPAHLVDARKLAETLVASRDKRIKYIISNAQIVSSKVSPWQWRPYTGENAHRQHCHISVMGEPELYDDLSPWQIAGPVTPIEPDVPGRQTNITATRFRDDRVAYSDVAPGWNDRYGVALPHRFQSPRPKVRVTNRATGKSVIAEIMDIGPWYDGTPERGPFDPYWQSGSRPRAESDPRTNKAGIDVTFPVDAALGLNGKGLVDWDFVTDDVADPPKPPIIAPPKPPDSIDAGFAHVRAHLADTAKAVDQLERTVKAAPPSGDTLADVFARMADELRKMKVSDIRVTPTSVEPATRKVNSMPVNQEQMKSIVRSILIAVGGVLSGWALSKGWDVSGLSSIVSVDTLAGLVVAALSAWWGVQSKTAPNLIASAANAVPELTSVTVDDPRLARAVEDKRPDAKVVVRQ